MRYILVSLAILLSMPQPAFSTADGPDHWNVYGVAKDDVLNIRKEADPNSAKVGEIPPDGQCIKNIRCVGGLTFQEFTALSEAERKKIEKERPRWCLIEYDGVTGWVNGRYLREGGCPGQ